MKNILIISPHFPPVNAPDMQRIRQSLIYYRANGWNPIIVCSDIKYVEAYTDVSLSQSIPTDIEVIKVKGLPYRITRLFGLGNLGLRSMFHYAYAVNKILRHKNIDLIFFSTTVFQLLVLGNYWRKKFNIPYVIDMQDPWLDYSPLQMQKKLRPKKFWFMHNLDKILEPIAMKNAAGVIAVTQQYIDVLKARYKNINDENSEVITFGFSENDFKIAKNEIVSFEDWNIAKKVIRGTYTGVVNKQMLPVIELIFKAFKEILDSNPQDLNSVKLYFIGTNYATGTKAKEMVKPLALKYGIDDYIIEVTSRVPYLTALKIQLESDFLLLIGSTNRVYTASKLYPYLYSQKPILAIFNKESSVIDIFQKITSKAPIAFSEESLENHLEEIKNNLLDMMHNKNNKIEINFEELRKFSAEELTLKQVEFFDKILDKCKN